MTNGISQERAYWPVGRTRRKASSLALALYFVVFSGCIYLLFSGFSQGELSEKSGDSPLYLSLLLLTYAVVFYQLAARRGAALSAIADSPVVLLFVLSGAVSFVTAGALGISVMRFVLYIATISAGLAISIRYSLDEFCEAFFHTSLVITIAYFLAYPILAGQIVYDALGRTTVLGVVSYAGLFPHKSVAATFFSLSLIISIARYLGSRGVTTRRLSTFLALASLVGLLISGAVGRLLFLLVSVLVSLVIRSYLRRDLTSLILFGVVLTLGGIAYFTVGDDTWIYVFGRNWSLTGRQELFDVWPTFFMEKPFFGFGYGGFFTDVAGAPGSYVTDLIGGYGGFSTFESVYLDLLIQFGSFGGAIFGCILLSALVKSLRYYVAGASKYKFVPVLLAVWLIIGSTLDSGILNRNAIDAVVLFWIYFGVNRAQELKPRRAWVNRNYMRRHVAAHIHEPLQGGGRASGVSKSP